eukprot:m.88185 g.88185  ORF g.88185 m.88185 type:complete len:457 (-) comp15169_c0_seq1:166-1536(-)
MRRDSASKDQYLDNMSTESTPLMQGRSLQEVEQPPVDHYNVTYLMFLLQGLGMLLPWNAFINVTSYFSARLENSKFENSFENYFSFLFQAINLVMLAWSTRYGHRYDIKKRIIIPLLVALASFSTTLGLVKVKSMSADTFFGVSLLCVLIAGSSIAVLQGGMFGLAGQLPAKYTQALMSGQGLAGLFVSLLNVLTLAIADGKPEEAAIIFFSISVVVIILCLVSFLVLMRQPMLHFYVDVQSHMQQITPRNSRRSYITGQATLYETFTTIRLPALLVFFNFFITLTIFPGLAANIASTLDDSTYTDVYFVALMCFLTFNLSDFIGRTLAGFVHIPSAEHYKRLTLPILLRAGFLPLFIFCNVQLLHENNYAPYLFHHDAFPYAFMFFMGLSNGYLGSLCMMYAPGLVDPAEAEPASAIMVFCLSLGIGMGCLFSFGVKGMLCHCNPFSTAGNSTSS